MTDSPDRPSRLIGGRYRLGDRLGSGSMGMVWSGYDELLHRPVAVKEVQLTLGIPDEEAVALRERTLREARAVAVLNQPNVITVYDVVVVDGAPFVVMELIAGSSLAGVLRASGPLSAAATASVADALAAALLAAHRAGITHRDVKPGNVLLGTAGQVKLTDFGIARSVSEATMTRTGIILGSPAYIAPEVAAGEQVTSAADLWSLGATLYAAVLGQTPYDEDSSVLATLHEVVHGDPPRTGMSGPLGEVIDGLLVKDPAQRLDLMAVRRIVHPLLPAPGESIFDLSSPQQQAEPPPPRPSPAPRPVLAAPPVQRAEPVRPLAGDPGPLPFVPTAHPITAARPRWRTPVVVAAAVLLFVLAGAGTFAAARVLGGQGLMPHQEAVPAKPATTASIPPLVEQRGRAQTLNGAQGGGFTVQVPKGWLSFVEQRNTPDLPSASVVHFVSEDGQQAVTIERIPSFYPYLRIADYLDAVRRVWPNGALNRIATHQLPGTGTADSEPITDFQYRTLDSSGATALARTTYARAVPDGRVLWVISVQVPVDQEDHGLRDLFQRIAPTFRPDS